MTNNKAVVIVELDSPVHFHKEILGLQLPITINGHKYTINFPEDIPKEQYTGPLRPPRNFKHFKLRPDRCFGFKWDSKNNKITIDTIILETEESNIKITYDHINEYLGLFNAYSLLVTGEHIINAKVEQDKIHSYFIKAGDTYKRKSMTTCANITTVEQDHYKKLRRSDIEEICHILSNRDNWKMEMELEYLISSLKSYAEWDYRRAVLDAATSCDIILRKRAEAELLKYPKIRRNAIMSSRHGIGDLNDLLKLLGIDVGSYNIEKINKPRNDAIHSGKDVTSKEAQDAITEARRIILRYSENEIVKYINKKS